MIIVVIGVGVFGIVLVVSFFVNEDIIVWGCSVVDMVMM